MEELLKPAQIDHQHVASQPNPPITNPPKKYIRGLMFGLIKGNQMVNKPPKIRPPISGRVTFEGGMLIGHEL